MKVMEVLGGGRYRCFYAGAHYEVFAPSAASLSVGDLVMARVVRKAGQLFVPKVAAGAFIIGCFGRNSATKKADVWQRSSAGAWNLLASLGGGVPEDRQFTYGFWWHAKSKFYLCSADNESVAESDIYELNLTTGGLTALGLTATMNPGGAHRDNRIVAGCIFGDNFYLVGKRYQTIEGSREVIYQFTGTALTVVDNQGYGSGHEEMGICTDGTTIYSTMNVTKIRKSTDGTTWSDDQTFNPITDIYPYGRMVYNLASSKLQVGAGDGAPSPDDAAIFQRNGSWAVDQLLNGGTANRENIYSQGFHYASGATIPIWQYALNIDTGLGARVFQRAATGGTFALETDLPAIISGASGAGKAFASVDGKILFFGNQSSDAIWKVFSRAGDSGIWTIEASFTNAVLGSPFDIYGLFEVGLNFSPDRR